MELKKLADEKGYTLKLTIEEAGKLINILSVAILERRRAR